MIQEIRSTVDPKHHDKFLAELMIGVAGQTYDSLTETVYRIISEANINRFFFNHWMFLPNSPGADLLYQRLHKIKWIKGYTIDKGLRIPNVEKLEDIYKHIQDNQGLVKNTKESTLVYSTSTMSFVEMIAMHILQSYLHSAAIKFGPLGNLPSFPEMFQTFKTKSLSAAKAQFVEIDSLIDQYQFVVFGSYQPDQKQINFRWTA
jgi:hypothetical protein